MKKRKISMVFDPEKPVERVDFMNAIAGVCRILHTDPLVKTVQLQIAKKGKVQKSYDIKIAN